jgi:hypothetical protein
MQSTGSIAQRFQSLSATVVRSVKSGQFWRKLIELPRKLGQSLCD